MWLPCSPFGAQPLGFSTSQLFRVYPWQAYLPPSDGLWPMLGEYQIIAESHLIPHSVIAVSDTSKPQVAPSIKS